MRIQKVETCNDQKFGKTSLGGSKGEVENA
jgi:hypothetical protein